jgi:hypothetical protein
MASVYNKTFDCADPRGLATFWATALSAEVERLSAAAATLVDTLRDPETFVDPMHWAVLQDPEGNEFCVIERRGEHT